MGRAFVKPDSCQACPDREGLNLEQSIIVSLLFVFLCSMGDYFRTFATSLKVFCVLFVTGVFVTGLYIVVVISYVLFVMPLWGAEVYCGSM